MKRVNGVKKTDGLITTKITIFETEEEIDVHIIENEDFDNFIVGLGIIKKIVCEKNSNICILLKL